MEPDLGYEKIISKYQILLNGKNNDRVKKSPPRVLKDYREANEEKSLINGQQGQI